MLKMTGFDVLFAAAGNLYLLLAAVGIGVALWKSRTWTRKLIYAALVLAFAIAPIAPEIYRTMEYRGKLSKAEALFEEHCKTVGEKIYKTVEGVEGVVWMKWRPKDSSHGQFELNDPYGKDCSGEGCILKLLRVNVVPVGGEAPDSILSSTYKFVETIDPSDGIRYRYKGIYKSITDVPRAEFLRHVQRTGHGADTNGQFLALQREPISKFSVNFGVIWDDVSTRTDREYWIAGGSLKVINIQTNEVIAERLGYLMDTGQGSTAGARDPWGWAQSYGSKCPQQSKNSVNFVTRVLNSVGI